MEQTDEDHRQDQTDEADEDDDVPGLVEIARRLLYEVEGADQLVQVLHLLARCFRAGRDAAMQHGRPLVDRKLRTRAEEVENRIVVLVDAAVVQLVHVEVVAAQLRAFLLREAVKRRRVVNLPRRALLHADLHRLLDFLQVEEENVRLIDGADAGNISWKTRLLVPLVGSDPAGVAE